jgi:hypothetical protein
MSIPERSATRHSVRYALEIYRPIHVKKGIAARVNRSPAAFFNTLYPHRTQPRVHPSFSGAQSRFYGIDAVNTVESVQWLEKAITNRDDHLLVHERVITHPSHQLGRKKRHVAGGRKDPGRIRSGQGRVQATECTTVLKQVLLDPTCLWQLGKLLTSSLDHYDSTRT